MCTGGLECFCLCIVALYMQIDFKAPSNIKNKVNIGSKFSLKIILASLIFSALLFNNNIHICMYVYPAILPHREYEI